MILISAAMIYVGPLAPSALAQFQWSQRIASDGSLPEGELNTGLALDTNDNCYVTGWFDGTNNFGGIILTNHSTGGGSDIFVAKYNASGTLQWVQQAGGTTGNLNTGRGIGVDTNGNIYVSGGYGGAAKFGGVTLPSTSGEEFFLAKYNNAGAVQWVQVCTNGSSSVDGIGLTVDGAGNSYALVVVDYLGGAGGTVTFGSTNVTIPANGSTTLTVLVKYDNTGTAKWAQLFDSSQESYATKVAVDVAGNVYVRGTFTSDMTIGTSNLVVSAGSTKNMFIAKFNNSGVLVWVQQPIGGNVDEGGVAVDPVGNVFVSGAFDSNLNFGTNLNGTAIILTNIANSSASFGDAFLAKYNSAGVIQWAQAAGGANGGFYFDIALDAQTNIYAAGGLISGAAVSKYSPAGTLQWTYAANGPPPNPIGSIVAKCAVDAAGHCYVDGIYQGTTTFGTNALQPQEAYNCFLAETVTNPTVQFSASPTSGLPPLTVQFNSTNVDSQGNTISSWNWNFGDGTTTNTLNPSHTYTNTGTFNPSFVATNNHNVAVIGYGPQIAVTNPIILFTANPTNGLLPLAVQFNAYGVDSAGNNIISWNWNFGDGITTNGQYPSHTYTNAGTFNPTLVATNNQRIAVIGFGPQITTLTSASPTNLTYTIQNGTVTITGYIGSGGVVNIPPTINGYPVTAIGNGAFIDTSLTSITIPNNVTNIGSGAFMNCTNLTSAAIQGGTIGGYALYDCYSLTNVTLGTNVTSIGAYAFSGDYYDGDPLSSITIPNSVTNIGDYAFYYCTSLTSAAIQGGAIEDYAFSGCYSLTSVTLGTNVTSIGAYAFFGYYGWDPLSSITIPNSVTSIGDYAFYDTSLTSVTIPNSVTNIGEYAFYDCTSLTSAAIQGGTIGDYAFEYCYSLTSVTLGTNVTSIGAYAFGGDPLSTSITIPNSVTSIGTNAFYDCTSLTNISVDPQNADYSSTNGVLFDKHQTTLIQCPGGQRGSYTIPNSVTSIGDYAFYGCTSLTNVTLGTNVTSIGDYAFGGGSIFFSSYYTFYPGTALSSVVIPNSVTNIGKYAFYGCNLQNATIESGAIGDYAFYDCINLINVSLGANVTSIGACAFSGEQDGNYNRYGNYSYFNGADPLQSVAIPSSVTSIGTNAFYYCTNLTSAAIQGGAIGDYAFYYCTSLTNATFGTNVPSIGDDAFDYCYRLTNVTIPNSVTNIGDYAFNECISLTSAAIQGGTIGDSAFYDCSSLTNVTLGTNVTSIGADAFSGGYYYEGTYYGGDPLSSITIPNSVTSIGEGSFYYCISLTKVTLGANVTSIGTDAFFYCFRLASITIPNSVTNIGDSAFSYCYLHQAYFQGNAPTVDGQLGTADSTVFYGESGMAYYLPGTTGWGATFGGWPTAGWYQPKPTILGNGYGLGVRSNSFGFTISWATNLSIIVQATTNLANPVWTPLATNPLVGGTNYFSDSKWTNYPGRFYRVRSQ